MASLELERQSDKRREKGGGGLAMTLSKTENSRKGVTDRMINTSVHTHSREDATLQQS